MNISDYSKTIEHMKHLHGNQTRSQGTPYWSHPHAVFSFLRMIGVSDPTTLTAALLHDVLEDTDYTAAEMIAEYGVAVTNVVLELTYTGEPAGKELAILEKAKTYSPEAAIVKMADRLHNLSDSEGVWHIEKRAAYAETAHELCNIIHLGKTHMFEHSSTSATLLRSCLWNEAMKVIVALELEKKKKNV